MSAKESTVLVETPTGHGSGVCIGWQGDRALILTAKHVVDGVLDGAGISVRWTHEQETRGRDAVLVRLSDKFDLALLSVYDPTAQLKPVHLSNTNLATGDLVFAIGYPLNIWPAISTIGTCRGINSSYYNLSFTFHSAGIWFGNSGGPLFNASGDLVGINVWIDAINEQPYSDLGGAVMLDQIIEFMELG